jgi:nucleoside-diphosphate-sugar epimerase
MKFELKKIYITGVSGFIGSYVAKLFVEKGYHVIGISKKSGSVVSKELGIEVIESDLLDRGDLILQPAKAIIHCATANDILSKDMEMALSLSIVGTSKILQAARNAKISKFIFFSTAQVYGTELNGYYDELTTISCETPYAINHYLGEELCKFYCNTEGFDITVLRPANVFGVPEISTVNRKTLVPMCFVDAAINHGSITLRSSGKQKRNFISIDQLTSIIFGVIENFPKGFSIRNCGSNLYMSILEIVNIVSNQYQDYFKKKLTIIVASNDIKNSNEFEYQSKFIKYTNTKKVSLINMQNVIEKLFQVWIKN